MVEGANVIYVSERRLGMETIIKLSLKSKVICKDEKFCTTDRYHCKTCLRNQANKYEDKFSLTKEGYKSKWYPLDAGYTY